jgi:hypothetical protein
MCTETLYFVFSAFTSLPSSGLLLKVHFRRKNINGQTWFLYALNPAVKVPLEKNIYHKRVSQADLIVNE